MITTKQKLELLAELEGAQRMYKKILLDPRRQNKVSWDGKLYYWDGKRIGLQQAAQIFNIPFDLE